MSSANDDNIFDSKIYELDEAGNQLHLIDIKSLNPALKSYIDQQIVAICEGESEDSINEVKEYLIGYFKKKSGSTIETGSIAEFFIHLYLRHLGYRQEFLYRNLEELSIKKGFDGYYTLNSIEWIMESKSGSISTTGISHNSKIKEAYSDLRKKLSGKSESDNNPWKNAFTHASLRQVNSADDLLKNLNKFSKEFQKGQFHNIKDLNIIPSSTIFMDNNWRDFDREEIQLNLSNWLKENEYKGLLAIGISKQSTELFLNYLLNK